MSTICLSTLKVEAADSDDGLNSDVTYSIVSGNLGGVFQISSFSGEVTVAKDIDRENVHEYLLGVQAKDGEKKNIYFAWKYITFMYKIIV